MSRLKISWNPKKLTKPQGSKFWSKHYSIKYQRAAHKSLSRKGEELFGVKLLHDLVNCCLQRGNLIPKVFCDIGSVFKLWEDNILKVFHPSFDSLRSFLRDRSSEENFFHCLWSSSALDLSRFPCSFDFNLRASKDCWISASLSSTDNRLDDEPTEAMRSGASRLTRGTRGREGIQGRSPGTCRIPETWRLLLKTTRRGDGAACNKEERGTGRGWERFEVRMNLQSTQSCTKEMT